MKIRRFNRQHINEDDQQIAPVQQPANATQPAAAQNTNAPLQNVAAPAEQPAQPQQSPANLKITEFLNSFKGNVEQHMNSNDGIYWALAYNLPEEIQKAVPEFKQGNPEAGNGINAWNTFKQNPSREGFLTLVDELAKFGTQPQQQQQTAAPATQQPVQQQPVQQQQPAAQPAAPAAPVQQQAVAQPAQQAPVQQAVAQQAQQESLMKSFGKRLHESLERQLHDERIHNAIVENAVIGHPDGWIA